jgi:tRNA pseudouridine55 synthase
MSAEDFVLPVDKPAGWTSHDVVARARGALRTRRVGHTGTLDPFATGLLLLCVGRATRIAEYLTALPKRYEAVARLGQETDTDDGTGRVVAGDDEAWRRLAPDAVAAAFTAQVGALRQVPPAYSAKKVAGERMYERARRGAAVDLAAVAVRVHWLDVHAVTGPEVRFGLECSSGTYVRAVARDAGRALGVGAHLSALRRTGMGPHDVAGALAVDALDDAAAVAAARLPLLAALAFLPRADVDDDAAARLRSGGAIPAPAGLADAAAVAVAHDDALLAIARAAEGRLQPRKVLGP